MRPIRLDVYHHFAPQHPLPVQIDAHSIHGTLDSILVKLSVLARHGDTIMATLDALTAQVAATTTIEQSALVLIEGIAARIAAAGVDPVAIQALTDSLKGSADSLSAAVVANTPPAA